MRELLELSGLVMLLTSTAVVGLALGAREVKVARRQRVQRALAAALASVRERRLPRRVRRAVLLELADLLQRDSLEERAPLLRATAADARRDLRSRRWPRRARGLRTLQSLGLDAADLVAALADRHPRVRAQAAIAGVGRHEPEVLEALVHLLRDHHPYVRFNALDAVTRRGTGTAVALRQALAAAPLLTYDELPPAERAAAEVDARAALTTRRLGAEALPDRDAGAVPRTERVDRGVVAVAMPGADPVAPGRAGTLPRPLRSATATDADTRILLMLLRGASSTTDSSSLEQVRRFAHDARPEVRAAAVDALTALGADPADLVRLLDDPDGRVRAATVTALGRSRTLSLSGLVAGRLTDRDHGVRLASASALTALGAAGRLLLQAAVTGGDRYAADAARSALGLPPAEQP